MKIWKICICGHDIDLHEEHGCAVEECPCRHFVEVFEEESDKEKEIYDSNLDMVLLK